MITDGAGSRQPTKRRLIDAGVRLFAERGFRETTVGDIEAAVGLAPRRGALYRHFPSKEALLEAALEERLATVAEAGAALENMPVTDLESEVVVLGRWLMSELDAEQPIVRILEQDGERLPDLREAFRQRIVDAGYQAVAELIERWLGEAARTIDIHAVAVMLLGSLVNFRRSTWTFGDTPLEMETERFLGTWAGLCTQMAKALSQAAT